MKEKINLLVVGLLLICLIGCENDESLPESIIDTERQYTLTVMADQGFFMELYGKYFIAKHPNVELQFIAYPDVSDGETRLTTYSAYMERHQPDLISLDYYTYHGLAANGYLLGLEDYMKRGTFDPDTFHPGVLDRLQDAELDEAYGLSPYFVKKGLFYNESVFDQFNLPYPESMVTWDEVIDVAQRFRMNEANDKLRYGVYLIDLFGGNSNDYASLVYQFGAMHGLKLVAEDSKHSSTSITDWEQVIRFVSDNFQKGLFVKDDPARSNPDYFANGEAAMALAENMYMLNLQNASSGGWGVVPEPVTEQTSNQSYSIQLREVLSIHANSDQKGVAWALLEYVHSAETAEVLARAHDNLLLSRTYDAVQSRYDFSAFYLLEHAVPGLAGSEKEKAEQISSELEQAVEKVIAGELTGAEAVEVLQ